MENCLRAFGLGCLNLVRSQRIFLISVVMILLVTALLKLHASVMSATTDYLDRPDEIVWFLSHRQLLLCAGLMELAIARLLTQSSVSEAFQLKAVVWLAVCFVAYRLARWAGHVTAPCGCLGVLASPVADRLSKAALGWMFGGSTLFLLWPCNRSGLGNEQPLPTVRL